MKKADTWMPWYVSDYLADTAHLTTELHGAYCLMLMAAWKRGGSLPNDDAQLAAVARMAPARWRSSRSVLVAFFREDGANLVHGRVTRERQRAQEISDKKAISGSKGASARWQDDGKTMANAIANASQTDAPSPSHHPENGTKPAIAGLSAAPPPAPQLVLIESPAWPPPCPHKQLVALFKQRLPMLPAPRAETWANSAGAAAMGQRWKWLTTAKRESGERYAETVEQAIDWFDRFFQTVEASDFLTGRSGKWAKCSLSWLMQREKFNAVIEGRYDNDEARTA